MRKVHPYLPLAFLFIGLWIVSSVTAQSETNDTICSELELRIKEQKQVVLLRNEQEIIPYLVLEKDNFALVSIGQTSSFQKRVKDYLEMPNLQITAGQSNHLSAFLKDNPKTNRLIIAIEDSTLIDLDYREFLSAIQPEIEITWVLFYQPDNPEIWNQIRNNQALLYTAHNTSLKQDIAAQILFGGMGATGKLTSSLSEFFRKGAGLDTEENFRLQYTIPEVVHLNGQRIQSKIDSIIQLAIDQQAFPGCQVLVAMESKVIFRQSYGYHTYDQRTKVEDYDLYDLASVTKICGPLPLLIHMHSANLLDPDVPFSNYWSDWKRKLFHCSNKDTITLRQLLTHQARLTPYIPFWKETKKKGHYKSRLYRPQQLDDYSLEIDDHLYLKDNFKRNVLRTIRKSDLLPTVAYRYTCLPSIVYPSMITEVTGKEYESLLYETIFNPLGASRLVYNPLQKGFSKEEIAPTEEDPDFRESIVHGRVHDEAAAILGGVSGNAGLFSNANDLAKLMQFYLNNGHYAGYQILPRELMQAYTLTQFPNSDNRRAMGFDKPLKDNSSKTLDDAWPAPGASYASYGHSGFTGTFVWVDPVYNFVYVFLSNRVYPSREHNAISRLNVRTAIQQVFYDEIELAKEDEINRELQIH